MYTRLEIKQVIDSDKAVKQNTFIQYLFEKFTVDFVVSSMVLIYSLVAVE